MNKMFTQPTGPVAKQVNKQAIARIFGLKNSQVGYLSTDISIDSYNVLFDKETQTCWYRGNATGVVTSWNVSGDTLTLTTNIGTFTLYIADLRKNLNSANAGFGASMVKTTSGKTVEEALKNLETSITLEKFGFVAGSTEDQTAIIQQAIYYAVANNITLLGTPGAKGYTTTGIIIPPTLRADWRGFTIKTVTSGITAVTVASGASAIVLPYVPGTPLQNLIVEGRLLAGTTSTPDETFLSDGIVFGAANSSQVSDLSIYGLSVYGFRDDLVFNGPSVYLLRFFGPRIGGAHRRGIAWQASVNSGENIQFFGGSVYNCINSTLTALAVYHSAESTGLEMTFNGTSFDYNDQDLQQLHSTFRFNECHLENNNNQPKITIKNTSQRPASILQIRNSNMGGGPVGSGSSLNSERESANGRPCFIDVLGANTSIQITGVSAGKWMLTPQVTQIVRNTAGHAMRALTITTVSDVGPAVTQGWPINHSFALNELYVAPSGSTTGWTLSDGSGLVFSSSTLNSAPHDTGSRRVDRPLSVSATSMAYYQDIPVTPGKSVILKAWITTTGVVSVGGYAAIRVQFYNSTKTLLIADSITPRRVTADGVLTECATVLAVPNGASIMRVQIYATDIPVGTDASLFGSGERVWTSN